LCHFQFSFKVERWGLRPVGLGCCRFFDVVTALGQGLKTLNKLFAIKQHKTLSNTFNCKNFRLVRNRNAIGSILLFTDLHCYKTCHLCTPVCVVDVANHTAFDYLVNPYLFNPTHSSRVFNQIALDLLIQCSLESLPMNTPTMQTIENIKEKAEKAGFTITDVARYAGFDPSQVSRYATGRTIPLVTSIQRLEESVDSLIQQRIEALNGRTE